MNYLAHCLLAGPAPAAQVGALLGDFVKGRLEGHFEPAILAAIRLHRRIDSYTDAHAEFRTARGLFSSSQRRYAGVIVDVAYDHFLSCDWPQYCEVSLPDFATGVYRALIRHRAILPDRLHGLLPQLIGEDLLTSYGDLATVERTLKRISRRLKRPHDLAPAAAEVERNYAVLRAGFQRFFPELVGFARSVRGDDPGPAGRMVAG